MKRFLSFCCVTGCILWLTSCQKEPELRSRNTYVWFETEIYDAASDSIISIQPGNSEETYRVIVEWWGRHMDIVNFYKGDKLLLSCSIDNYDPADGDETNCLDEDYCFELSCGYTLCLRYFGTIDNSPVYVLYQFPYLEGNFESNCHSSSLFKMAHEDLN